MHGVQVKGVSEIICYLPGTVLSFAIEIGNNCPPPESPFLFFGVCLLHTWQLYNRSSVGRISE